jgi:glycosyltransferase involved in cell wall biosynthesis
MKTTRKRILLLTGSIPPQVCGVGDYSKELFDQLQKTENEYILYHKLSWSFRYIWRYLTEIKSLKADLIHIQYPTEGFGYSILPLALMWLLPKRRLILTVHEYSRRTVKAKLFTWLLICSANIVLVSNEEEKDIIKQQWSLGRKNVSVIPIGSNIPKSKFANKAFEERGIDFAYFGHIRPLKGIEAFISAVRSLTNSKSSPKRFAIIGQSLQRYTVYLEELKSNAKDLNIEFILNSSNDLTADLLANCKIIYLPFPDGISERRGSLMAAATNGYSVVSTPSQRGSTNDFFEPFCYLSSAEQLLETVHTIFNQPTRKVLRPLSELFSWDAIVARHIALYDACLADKK